MDKKAFNIHASKLMGYEEVPLIHCGDGTLCIRLDDEYPDGIFYNPYEDANQLMPIVWKYLYEIEKVNGNFEVSLDAIDKDDYWLLVGKDKDPIEAIRQAIMKLEVIK